METTISCGGPTPDPNLRGGLRPGDLEVLRPRYEIYEEVALTGLSVVYKARHRLLDLLVALKVCLAGQHQDRFLREAQLLASLYSPHLVTVRNFELLTDGRGLLVMDWVEGYDLHRMLKNNRGQPLQEIHVLPWMLQVCAGMQAAAEKGIVHRDVKPSNILIDNRGQARVADFGLARSPHADLQLSLAGDLMGTPYYMAPEQAEDPRCVDTRADIYSFGATFYHLLTGRPPFDGATAFVILLKHKTEPLLPPQTLNPRLDPRVGECLERCMAKSPGDRFATFADVAASLQPQSSAPSPWDLADDPEVARIMEGYRSRQQHYLSGWPGDLPAPDVYQFAQGRLLIVQYGDITEQAVDAVVSSDDEMLSMGGGVSAAIRRAAGPDMEDEARRFVPVRAGRAVVTSAGSMPARFVFHGVTLGSDGSQWVLPSRDLISEILESCFYHADTLGVESIAFPLLATSEGKFPRDVCLDTMFRFLTRKLLYGITTVRQVRIILFAGPRARRG